MKVLLLTHNFSPVIGGIESYSLGLAKALRENNIECSVVCLNRDLSGKKLPKEDAIQGIPVKRVGFIDLGFYKIAFGLLGEIKKADLVHVQNIGFLSDFALLTKPLHKKPVVISTHGGISHTKKLGFLKRIYSKWLGFLLKGADFVIADSAQDFAEFEKKARAIRLVQNGVDLEQFFAVQRKTKKHSFIFVGRLATNKRIDLLLDAFYLALKQKPNAMLRIVGKDFDNVLYNLQKKTIDLEISNRVFFMGGVSFQELLDLLAGSEFFVSASEAEGFGISAVEAMAAGCIPVLNNIDAFRAFVEDKKNGFLANFLIPGEASAKMAEAMDIGNLEKKQLSDNARQGVQKYSWNSAAKEVIEIYGSLVQ